MCDQPQPTGIYQAMAEILAEIPSIGKDNKNKEQGFKYRGIDDVYNALHPLLAKHKVFMAPTVLSRASEDRTTAKGGAMQCVTLSVEYRFFHADGSSISCTVMGEGRDTSDKATNKAMASAHKYALLQTFCIPTEDIGQDDPDAETPEPVQPRQDARPQVMSGPVDFDKVRAELARMTTEEELQEYWKKVRVEKGTPPLHPAFPAVPRPPQGTRAEAGNAVSRKAPPHVLHPEHHPGGSGHCRVQRLRDGHGPVRGSNPPCRPGKPPGDCRHP